MDAPNAEPHKSEAEVGCDETRRAIGRFVAGDDGAHERTRARAHIARCGACREHYRETVEAAGRFARATTRAIQRSSSSEDLPRRVSFLSASQRRGPTRWTKAALIVLGLSFAFAVLRPDKAGERVRLSALAGDVRCGERQLGRDDDPLEIARDSACSTGLESRARLRSGENRASLEPATAVVALDPISLQLQLLEGELLVEGSATVVTAAGAVEFSAAAGAVSQRGSQVRIRCDAGSARWSDARGVQTISPGTEVRCQSNFFALRRPESARAPGR